MVLAANVLPRPANSQTLEANTPRRRLSPGEALRLLKSPLFVTFLLAAGLIHGSHGMFYTFGVLHWNSQGIAPEWIGTLWAIAIPGEVLLFAYSGAVVRRLGAIPLLITGASAAVRLNLQRAYKVLYRSGLAPASAVERIRADLEPLPEVERLCEFIASSKRGIC